MNGRKKLRRRRTVLLVMLALALLAAGYLLWERPPELAEARPPVYTPEEEPTLSARPDELGLPGGEEAIETAVSGTGRLKGVYTLLLVGNDDGNGNTDTILLGRLDTRRHALDLVSIPRDTLVNVDWSVRKINAIYAGTANSGGVAIEGLTQELRKLSGLPVDAYAVVDLQVFVEAIDLIGGVDFEVPQDMHYDDPGQDLHIHLSAGQQHLSGEQAMGVVRYRSGYLNGDLDRLGVQQDFMKAALGQMISLGKIPRLPELVSLLAERTDSNLTAANIAWFARQLLQCRSEDIRFHTMPNVPATVHGLSYAVVELEPWLETVNACLNPYAEPVTAANLDVVYRDGGYRATSGVLRGAWYYE